MSKPRRMHPVAILIDCIRTIKNMLLPILVSFVGAISQLSTSNLVYFFLGGIGVFSLFLLWSLISWYRHTYYVIDGELRIESGLLIRNRRFIPKERIHVINISAGIFQRLFNLVKVDVETAGGGLNSEATLSAITKEESVRLRKALEKNNRYTLDHTEEISKQPPLPCYQISWKHLFIAASTSGGIGLVFSMIFLILVNAIEIFNFDFIEKGIGFFENLNISTSQTVLFLAALFFVVFAIAWIISVINTMLKYGGFTLTRSDTELKINYGILEKRELTVPLSRIQAITIVENVLHQPLGYASIYLVSAGYGQKQGEPLFQSLVMFPLLPKKKVYQLLQNIIPEFAIEAELNPIPNRARIRYLIKAVVPVLVFVVPISIFVPWGYYSLLALLPAVFYGFIRHRDAGWTLVDNTYVNRSRGVSLQTAIVPKHRIQSAHLNRSFFQKRKSLATFKVIAASGIAGKAFKVMDLDEKDGQELLYWYVKK